MKIHYTLEQLESLPTLSTGQFDDLKVETEDTRIWLSRMGVEDGEPYPNKVSVERYEDDARPNHFGQWVVKEEYQAV